MPNCSCGTARKAATVAAFALFAGQTAFAQSPPALTTAAQQQALRDDLLGKAAADPHGMAVGFISKSPSTIVEITARVRTGEAEQHLLWNDEIRVREGVVDLVTGGTMVGRHALDKPGEFRGSELIGATTTTRLGPGDFVEVPAGTYHWMKVIGSAPAANFVIKVRATPAKH